LFRLSDYQPGEDLAAWHLPGGPVGPASRWAATSNVEVGQTAYPDNRGRVWREGREVTKRRRDNRTGNEEWLYLDVCAGVPDFLVTPLLMRLVCLLRQGRYEEPDHSCYQSSATS